MMAAAERLTFNIPASESCSHVVEWSEPTKGVQLEAVPLDSLEWNVVVHDEMTIDLEIRASMVDSNSSERPTKHSKGGALVLLQEVTRGRTFSGTFQPRTDARCSSDAADKVIFEFSNRFSWWNAKDVELILVRNCSDKAFIARVPDLPVLPPLERIPRGATMADTDSFHVGTLPQLTRSHNHGVCIHPGYTENALKLVFRYGENMDLFQGEEAPRLKSISPNGAVQMELDIFPSPSGALQTTAVAQTLMDASALEGSAVANDSTFVFPRQKDGGTALVQVWPMQCAEGQLDSSITPEAVDILSSQAAEDFQEAMVRLFGEAARSVAMQCCSETVERERKVYVGKGAELLDYIAERPSEKASLLIEDVCIGEPQSSGLKTKTSVESSPTLKLMASDLAYAVFLDEEAIAGPVTAVVALEEFTQTRKLMAAKVNSSQSSSSKTAGELALKKLAGALEGLQCSSTSILETADEEWGSKVLATASELQALLGSRNPLQKEESIVPQDLEH